MKEYTSRVSEVLKWPKKADSTLMRYSKKQLIELLRAAEHNRDVAIETLAQQYQNVKDWEPIVRCKDCIYNTCQFSGGVINCHCPSLTGEQPLAMFEDDFCSYGEKEEQRDGK